MNKKSVQSEPASAHVHLMVTENVLGDRAKREISNEYYNCSGSNDLRTHHDCVFDAALGSACNGARPKREMLRGLHGRRHPE